MSQPTLVVAEQRILVRQFELSVRDAGLAVVSTGDELSVGTNDGNDLRLTDPAVSRHHFTLRADERGLRLTDLGSRNGTFVDGVRVLDCYVTSGSRIRAGKTEIVVTILDRELEQPVATKHRIGSVLGASIAMRRLYPVLEQTARSAATVLICGETGTGKELVAEAIHDASDRRRAPFVVIDCSALSHELAESELFGHERGAFTGAEIARVGAFESANGGTVFLDEIGEMPLALQPLLLRVLESRTIRRVGSNTQQPLDLRVIAASHRELRVEVNEKRFRADLFYRLNVVRVTVPPLRERVGDIALLAKHFWGVFRPGEQPPAALVEQLSTQSWPGNVRELRNAVERAALIGWTAEPRAQLPIESLTYQQAKEHALRNWERTWVEGLIGASGGNLSRAARAARMGRTHLRELARRHGIPTRGSSADPSEFDDDRADDPDD